MMKIYPLTTRITFIKVPFLVLAIVVFACHENRDEGVAKTFSKEKDGSPQSKETHRIQQLLSEMSLKEKIGQLSMRGKSSRDKVLPEALKEAVKEGRIGAMINVMDKKQLNALQRIAVEESRHGIPLLFSRDVIHGFKTIFPIPLGQAATWNPELVEEGARIAALEASAAGVKWTFAPMIDIVRDPRWGRVAESAGEDPFLTTMMGNAYIRGFQGTKLGATDTLAEGRLLACAKHFIGYGAAEGGRDYNTAIIHKPLLHNVYLRPFKSAKEEGVASFMTSFNELNGIPASAHKGMLKDLLREQWGFEGIVVSDWNSITEMIPHGFAEDGKHAAKLAADAGLDMEMTSASYEQHLPSLIREGEISERELDQMVAHVLRMKLRAGLFERPYLGEVNTTAYAEPHLTAAKESALQSIVMLKNDERTLPLTKAIGKIALIGPMSDAPHEQLGTWSFDGEASRTITPLKAFRADSGAAKIIHAPGLDYSRDRSQKGFGEAVAAAKQADVILFFGGEEAILSGEAHSRASIDLPGAQEELISELYKTGVPIVLVVMAGRPVTLGNVLDKVASVLFAWHPGTMGGAAIHDIVMGQTSPSGRLPMSFPKAVGQIPVHYNHKNTGRPPSKDSFVPMDSIPIGAWQSSLGNTSHYLDEGYLPQYPFGYGLTYTTFSYQDIKVDRSRISTTDSLSVQCVLTNEGRYPATEVVQLYVQDVVGSITRPVRELKAFQRIHLSAGESRSITFKLKAESLAFFTANGQWEVEPGKFNLWLAPDALSGLKTTFEVFRN